MHFFRELLKEKKRQEKLLQKKAEKREREKEEAKQEKEEAQRKKEAEREKELLNKCTFLLYVVKNHQPVNQLKSSTFANSATTTACFI